jgi:ribosomal protein S18 acetylase RimI-like enzyme
MLDRASTLTASDLGAIADLERRVLAADGGRLKLEWGALRSRSGTGVNDLLWREDGGLLGFLGVYGYGATIELAGMVDPAARRRGIASALLDAAVPVCRERAARAVLLVVPRPSQAGKALALARGATHDHAEHALVLRDAVRDVPHDDAVSLRPAGPGDASSVARLLDDGFGFTPTDEPDERTLIVERDGGVVGTLRLVETTTGVGVYGFVIDPALRGRGIGRDVLGRVCRDAQATAATEVSLEVEVDNDHALGLYTSLGFQPVITEDYYRLPLEPR